MKKELKNLLQVGEEEPLTTVTLFRHVDAAACDDPAIGNHIDRLSYLYPAPKEQDIAELVAKRTHVPEARLYMSEDGCLCGWVDLVEPLNPTPVPAIQLKAVTPDPRDTRFAGELTALLTDLTGKFLDVNADAAHAAWTAEPKRHIRVYTLDHGQWVCTVVPTDLDALQRFVGGNIQAVPLGPYELVCNEEGKVNGLPPTAMLLSEKGQALDIIAGRFFVCRSGLEDFESVCSADIVAIRQMFLPLEC